MLPRSDVTKGTLLSSIIWFGTCRLTHMVDSAVTKGILFAPCAGDAAAKRESECWLERPLPLLPLPALPAPLPYGVQPPAAPIYTKFADPTGHADALSSNCSSNCIRVLMSAKGSVKFPHTSNH